MKNKFNQAGERPVNWKLQNIADKDLNKWKEILCSDWKSLFGVTIPLQTIYRINAILIKIPMMFFADETCPKIHMEYHGTLNS